jgi:anti-sigma B factor antagonist
MSPTTGSTAPPEPWRVEVRLDPGGIVIELGGEFDLSKRRAVVELVQRELAKSPARLAIDLRGVTFIDSSGVHALIETSRLARQSGVEFSIIPGSRPIQRVFEVCGLTNHLPFVPDGEPELERSAH